MCDGLRDRIAEAMKCACWDDALDLADAVLPVVEGEVQRAIALVAYGDHQQRQAALAAVGPDQLTHLFKIGLLRADGRLTKAGRVVLWRLAGTGGDA